MNLDLIAFSKLNHVTKQRNVFIGLFAVSLILGIGYGVYEFNRKKNQIDS